MSYPEKILMVIPARGGSKRLPRKNVLPLAGNPLICWTIEAALNSGLNARILVSSDDDEILSIARRFESSGVILHKRPDSLATDTATTADVLIDAIETERAVNHSPDTLILLQPTSPLRTSADILEALSAFNEHKAQNSVVSVCEVDHPKAWIGTLSDTGLLEGIDLSGKRSQDYQKEYRLNGAVYVARTAVILEKRSLFTERLIASVMPRSRSVDIDNALDFTLCERIIERA